MPKAQPEGAARILQKWQKKNMRSLQKSRLRALPTILAIFTKLRCTQGNFRKVTQIYEDLLLKVIEEEPLEYGYV